MLIDKRGERAAPDRTVPASLKDTLVFPEDLHCISGTLDDLETGLRKRKR